MSASEYLGAYAQGWSAGNADQIISSLAGGYILDDPNAGLIAKQDFADYLAGMKESVRGMCGGTLPEPFMEISEVVTQKNEGVLTAWCCWAVPGTTVKGAGLIKVDDDGVQSEVLTYYTKLSE